MSDRAKSALAAVIMCIAFCGALYYSFVKSDDDKQESITRFIKTEASGSVISSGITAEESVISAAVIINSTSVDENPTAPVMININTADKEELMTLDGIGEVLALRIITYRTEVSPFRNIMEIMNVSGIGEATFSGIKDRIYVVNPVYETCTTEAPEEVTETESEPETEAETVAETITEEPQTVTVSLDEIAPVNINTAGIDELMLLPYVDKEAAEAIIRLREEINGFSDVHELILVEELEQKETAEILKFVTVGE